MERPGRKSYESPTATMKPMTPGQLTSTLPARTVHFSTLNSSLPVNNTAFLAYHHKRVFPLNISHPISPLDSYQPAFYPQQSPPRGSAETARKSKGRAKSRPTASLDVRPGDPEPRKLPLLRAGVRERQGRARSIDYEDFVIGGNSYNASITEKLYQPQVIRVSDRSKFRLYFLSSPEKGTVKGNKAESPAHKKRTDKETMGITSPAPQRRQEALDKSEGIVYPRPALTFPEKLYRIKRLADTTLSFA